jgi:hypothetical protein
MSNQEEIEREAEDEMLRRDALYDYRMELAGADDDD